jgi:Methyltransferase domain
MTSFRRMAGPALRAFAADPRGVLRALPGHLRMQRFQDPGYQPDEHWDEHFHRAAGAAWPCAEGRHVEALLSGIRDRITQRQLAFGRQAYGGYSDADLSLCRVAWCAVVHGQPDVVVETGVARGVTSRVVLEAMIRSGRGQLYSIDLPHPFDRSLHAEIGVAVTDECRARWTYLAGSSRDRLPGLLRDVRTVQLFIHDSLHTAANTRFEMDHIAAVLSGGGVMIVDDISTHDGFATFTRQHPGYQAIVCPSADRRGLFGLAVKPRTGPGMH